MRHVVANATDAAAKGAAARALIRSEFSIKVRSQWLVWLKLPNLATDI